MAGYIRQSAASIISGATVTAAGLNAEFNQLAAAFDGTTGHAHDGSTGNGPVLTAAAIPATFNATTITPTASANLTLGSGTALATSATTGLVGIPTCAGTPTGVPIGHVTGTAQLIYDTTDSFLFAYNNAASAWANVGVTFTPKVTRQIFTSTGTYTPTSGMKYCLVQMVGPGAGGFTTSSGGFGGGGGAAGEYAEGLFTASDIGVSKAVTVGTGGAASTNGSGPTSLGSLLTAAAGSASTNSLGGEGGLGGTGGTGTGLHVQGGDGFNSISGTTSWGGQGGPSFLGGGGRGGAGNLDLGKVGRAYGSGGGGGGLFGGTYSAGAAGKDGIVIITEYQ